MGGRGSGRRSDPKRVQQALKLRARGLTLVEIGQHLGMTHQGVSYLLGKHRGEVKSWDLHCQSCGKVFASVWHDIQPSLQGYCRTCLMEHPEVPYAVRLQSCRLAAGLTRQQLAEQAGLRCEAVRNYEEQINDKPRRENAAKLARALGVD